MEIKKEFIFEEEGRLTHNSHASTILKMSSGELLAAWFGGTKEKNPDVEIYASIKTDGKWCKPFVVSEINDTISSFNPVLFLRKDGTINLYFKLGLDCHDWHTMFTYSKDNGRTWAKPVELVKGDIGGRGPVKNKPIRLSDGTVIAPASNEQNDEWKAFFDISHDDGLTFERTDYIYDPAGEGIIQPTLWEEGNGTVHAFMRSCCDRIVRSTSNDYGKTWGDTRLTDIPNNNSGIDLVKAEDGNIYLVLNPVTEGRVPIEVWKSTDNGETWETIAVLETEGREFSYPAIIADGNKLHITYTYNRRTVAYCEISL